MFRKLSAFAWEQKNPLSTGARSSASLAFCRKPTPGSVGYMIKAKSALFRATHVMNSLFGGERHSKLNKYMQDIGDIY